MDKNRFAIIGRRQLLKLEYLETLSTPRLLDYYKKVVRNNGPSGWGSVIPDKERLKKDYPNDYELVIYQEKVKEMLDGREHVERD